MTLRPLGTHLRQAEQRPSAALRHMMPPAVQRQLETTLRCPAQAMRWHVLQATQCRRRKHCTHAYLGPLVKLFGLFLRECLQNVIVQAPQA